MRRGRVGDEWLQAIVSERRLGVPWKLIANRYGYANEASAYGSVRMMARKRGLKLYRLIDAPKTMDEIADAFMDEYRRAGYTDADAYRSLTRSRQAEPIA